MPPIPYISFLLLISCFSFAQIPVTDSVLALYTRLNEDEKRLTEFKDTPDKLLLKLKQLEIINSSREKYQAKPVQLDIFACRLANKMAREAAENHYTGHWNMKGEKPYHRYAFEGGKDHISENASGKTSSELFNEEGGFILNSMNELHQAFMNEKAPHDGHKTNCIDQAHNYVGIGFFVYKNEFRYYEEYIDRYFFFDEAPVLVKKGQEFYLKIRTSPGYYLCYLVAYKDKFPKKMKPAQLNMKNSYYDFSNKTALIVKPWSFPNYHLGDYYKIPLSFSKKGLYYIHIFQDIREYRTPKKFTTAGKIQGSGLVIKVE